jgi:nicotinate-nucleotide pyrophosphorylase (carboxylating)
LELCAKLQRFPEIARIVDPMLLPPLLDEVILRALQEDLAGGDLSAEACVPLDRRARARALAKSPLITCGGVVFRRVFELVDPTTVVHLDVPDGEPAQDRRCLWRVEGLARSLLQAERTALNFAQRMSGTATLARACVNALPAGSGTRVTDTRKTTPGLRALERYAVRTGGAHNHRNDLGAAVMIKDNHIVAAGGIAAAVERARRHAPHTSRVEVEVASLDELEQALAAKVDIVMLDNFDDAMVSSAVARVSRETPRPLVEVSGGVTLERIGILGGLGVDVISVGALTHSARAADISLELELV